MEGITIPTGVGSLKINGKHTLIAFAVGVVVGTVALYCVQRKFNVMIPKPTDK